MRVDVAIIGAGLAGLSCAIGLRGSGLSVALFEAGPDVGGRAASRRDCITGDAVDLGPHIVLSEYRNMLALLDVLGTRDRIEWECERLIRLREGADVIDMHLHRLPPPLHLLPSFARVRSVSLQDKLSNWRVLRLAMRADERCMLALDDCKASRLLRRLGVTDRFIDWFWRSACLSVLNVPLERCSAGALLRVFSQLIGRRRYQIGFPRDGLAQLFMPEAMRSIVADGGRFCMRSRIERIAPRPDGTWTVAASDGARVQARFCVPAVPPNALRGIVPASWLGMPPFAELAAFEPCPYVSTYVWFDRKLTREKFWARIWEPDGMNTDFYDLSNIREGWRSRPSVIAANCIYSHRVHELSDNELIARTLQEISDALPPACSARVQHAVVHRIPLAIPCPAPGTERRRPATVTPMSGLLLAGDWTRTHLPASMESAVHSGLAAAQAIWCAIGKPRQLTVPKRPTEGFARLARRADRSE